MQSGHARDACKVLGTAEDRQRGGHIRDFRRAGGLDRVEDLSDHAVGHGQLGRLSRPAALGQQGQDLLCHAQTTGALGHEHRSTVLADVVDPLRTRQLKGVGATEVRDRDPFGHGTGRHAQKIGIHLGGRLRIDGDEEQDTGPAQTTPQLAEDLQALRICEVDVVEDDDALLLILALQLLEEGLRDLHPVAGRALAVDGLPDGVPCAQLPEHRVGHLSAPFRADEDLTVIIGLVLDGPQDTGFAGAGTALEDDDPTAAVGDRVPQFEHGGQGLCGTGKKLAPADACDWFVYP